ncbi:DNA repair protein RecO [Suttonella ornithocola]|nr:recombination protein O N-terminal domain-containing protein [Suttonella ornithocola]
MSYKENSYLVDLFTKNNGLQRAIVRIRKQKNYRYTENYAPFRELSITGIKRNELFVIQKSEILRYYQLNGKKWLSVSYLNELLLHHTKIDYADVELYHLYTQALQQPDTYRLRMIEWYLINELALIPERNHTASFYQLFQKNGWLVLQPALKGFTHELIVQIEARTLPLEHPQLKNYLQTILSFNSNAKQKTKTTAYALLQLLQPK